MHEWLKLIADFAITGIHALALMLVVFGTLQAFVHSVRAMFNPSTTGRLFHAAYIQFARWLVAALTFQLAADIIESAFSTSWEEVGRLAVIAAIRTFLNYFLERDLAELERRESQAHGVGVIAKSP